MTNCFDNHDLRRFIDAQDGGTSTRRDMTAFEAATEEDFLKNRILRDRLLSTSEMVISQLKNGVNPEVLLGGSTDCLKLSSSMTLFKGISQRLDDFALEQVCGDVLKLLVKSSIPLCAATEDWLQKISTY